MATKTRNIIVGTLILVFLLSGIIYISMDSVRIRVDNDKTTFYIKQLDAQGEPYGRWLVSGREYLSIFDGSKKLNRDRSGINIEVFINNITNITTIVKTTPYIRGPIIIQTYVFDGTVKDVELFPISHTVNVLNAEGFFLRYEVRDLDYSGSTYKTTGETLFSFGKNMKVEVHNNYRWAWIYKSGLLKAQYNIIDNNSVFNFRLFDPPVEHTFYLHPDGVNIVCGNTYLWDTANAPIGLGTLPNAVTCGTRTRIRDGDATGTNIWGATFYNTTAMTADTTVTAVSGHLHFINDVGGTMWYELCEYTGTVYNCFGNSSSVTDTSGADFEEDVTFTSSGTVSSGNYVAIKVWFNEATVATSRIYTSSTDGYNSSVVLSYEVGAGGIPNSTTWNQSTADMTVAGGSIGNIGAEVLVSGNLTNIWVTELSGNGTGFMAPNATNIGNRNHTENFTINFNCTPIKTQSPGYYISLYNVNATEDVSGDNITVSCTVTNAAPTVPTDILCDGSTNCNISVDASVILNATGSTDSEGNIITYSLEALLIAIFSSSDLEVGTISKAGEGGAGGGGAGVNITQYIEPDASVVTCAASIDITTSGIPSAPSLSDTSACASRTRIRTGPGGVTIFLNAWNTSVFATDTLVTPFSGSISGQSNDAGDVLWYEICSYNITSSTFVECFGNSSKTTTTGLGDFNDIVTFTAVSGTISAGLSLGARVWTDDDVTAGDIRLYMMDTTGTYNSWINLTIGGGAGGTAETNETNTTYTTYTDTGTDSTNINNVSIKIEIDTYNPEASVNQSTNDPDLSLEIWNSTDWIVLGNFTLPDTYTGTGLQTTNYNFTLTTTDATILSSWETTANQDIRIRGKYMDYVNATVIDEINWTNLWVTIDGKTYSYIGNHTGTTTYTWDTSGIDEQTGIAFRTRAIDLLGNNTYSSYFFKYNFLNISHAVGDPDTNFTIWDGAGWVDSWSSGEYITFRCTPTQTDCEPDNQNAGSSQSIYQVCNNGTGTGTNIYFHVNQTVANIALKCDDDYTAAGATTLTTSNQSIHTTIGPSACTLVSCWADYTSPTAGGYFDVHAYIVS